MNNKMCLRAVFFVLLPLTAFILLDYYDVPSSVGLHVNSLNYSFWDAIINAIIVITLYIITFIIVDRRQIKKYENAKNTVGVLMLYSYEKCEDVLKTLDNQHQLDTFIIPKMNYDESPYDNSIIRRMQEFPFAEYQSILDFAVNGSVTGNELKTYLKIMNNYREYVLNRITFPEIGKDSNNHELKRIIWGGRKKLGTQLELEIKRLRDSKLEG